METRELRYFLAVAEELHFGRAAQRLGIAQPPLSRAIGRLERRIGAHLLERTSRRVELTDAGQVLLREGRAALDAVEAAERRTRRAAQTTTGLVLASPAATEVLTRLLAAFAEAPDAVPVEVLRCDTGQQEQVLRDGRADVVLLHRPFDTGGTSATWTGGPGRPAPGGLHCVELTTERQVLLLPADHPFAVRAGVHLADLTDRPGLALVGESVRTPPDDGLVTVPVLDAPLVTTVLAWPAHGRSPGVAALVRTASRLF